MRKFVIYGLIVGIVSGVMIYLLNYFGGGINFNDLYFFFLKSWWGLIGIALLLVSWLTDALNTYILVRLSKSRIGFFQSLKATIISNFFGMITPSSTGGQPMQVVYLNKVGVSPGVSTSTLVFKFIAWQGAIEMIAIFELRRAIALLNVVPSALSLALIGFIISSSIITLMVLFNFNRRVYNAFFNVIRKFISIFKFSKKIRPKAEPTPGSSGTAEGEFYLFFSSIVPGRYLATITIEWGILRYFIPLIIGFIVVLFESLKGIKITPEKEKDVIIKEKSS